MKIRIFTDGACSDNPGPGGWAAVFNKENECETINGYELETTNNRMELKAVVESYKKILNEKKKYDETTEFELYSDSAYVVNAINNGWVLSWQMNKWKTSKNEDVKNRDLWNELSILKNRARSYGLYVEIIKIKGHAGNTFNELVDKLAKNQTIIAKEKLMKEGGQNAE